MRARRFWFECGGLAALALIAAFVVGRSAHARADALEREAARLEAVRSAAEGWIQGLQRPVPSESLAWRESEERLLWLGSRGGDPIAVARLVAQRAEEVGIGDLRVRLAQPDSVPPPDPVGAGRWAVEPGASALEVNFTGDWATILSFLGTLPPQVEAGDLRISPAGGRMRARVFLFTRTVAAQG